MPEALATSKRKFYKLLDNLTPATGTTTASTAHSPSVSTVNISDAQARKRPLSELQSLKRRILEEPLPAQKRVRSDLTRTSSLTRHDAKSIHTPDKRASTVDVVSIDATALPYFSPWSQQTFLARLKTFAAVTSWYPKPECINEVQWAKRGWECVDVETVSCRGGCRKRVIVDMRRPELRKTTSTADATLPDTDNGTEQALAHDMATEDINADDDEEEDLARQAEDFEQRLAERYQDQLINGHSPSCPWRRAMCKDDIYRLPVVRTKIWQEELRDRYTSLYNIRASITNLQLVHYKEHESVDRILDNLPPLLLDIAALFPTTVSDSSDTLHRIAFQIAMAGWNGVIEANTPLLSCSACFQRVGLWMYEPGYRRQSIITEDETEQTKLDLIEMHREHCPWRNGTSQCAVGEYSGSPAWEILWRVVGRFADETRRRSGGSAVVSIAPTHAADEEQDDAESLYESKEEIQRLDNERVTRLKRLKKVLGFKPRPRTIHM